MKPAITTQDGDQAYCIIDAPLPEAVDFSRLKDRGIEALKHSVGAVWSNYNDSDPGVTMLDQLCYALTELGYCAQFPIADVLTHADGKIHYHDQFFEPQDILTTGPVTVDDYRRLIHDQIPEVRVVYLVQETYSAIDLGTRLTGRYHARLAAHEGTSPSQLNAILQRAYVLLNQHRNIAEAFLPVQALRTQTITLYGSVVLDPAADMAQVMSTLRDDLLNYCAPLPQRAGFQELRAQGLSTDQIFDGPIMHRGWIGGAAALGEKLDRVSLFELVSLLAAIPGVAYVESLSFVPAASNTPDQPSTTGISEDALGVIALDPSFSFSQNGATMPADSVAVGASSGAASLEAMHSRHQAASIDASLALAPALPRGTYRDIEQYYSVQNTFPDQYHIGPNALHADAPSYQVACARQLKGYLMPFDQLLANQFSQLAHLGELFSFHPPKPHTARARTGKPVDVDGIGHKRFSTTYFCQPLYQVPDVKPLLAGHDEFRYQFLQAGPDKLIEQAEWTAYKQFPFNQYVHGLQQGLESEREADTRRDAMLNHLMARHGDDGKQYDEIISRCAWLGNGMRTRIAVKSIWLQNFQKLSYRRSGAFDCFAPATMVPPAQAATLSIPEVFPTIDGEPDQAAIYAQARLRKDDIDKFSTFELKAAILLGLPKYLLGLASRLNALLTEPSFVTWLALTGDSRQAFALPGSDTRVEFNVQSSADASVRMDQVFEGQQCLLDIVWTNSTAPGMAEYQAHAVQLLWLATERRGMMLIEPTLFLPPTPLAGAIAQDYFFQAQMLLPGYVHLLQQSSWLDAMNKLVELHWPAHVGLKTVPSTFNWLKAFIPAFVRWQNSQPAPGRSNLLAGWLAKLLKLSALPAQGG